MSDDTFFPTIQTQGQGQPVMVLHGGGGPFTVAGLAQGLAARHQVFTPTHPGWNGTPRPAGLSTISQLAALYLGWLTAQDLRGVVLVGSSVGGWLAAELALQDRDERVAGLVLLDAVGIDVPGEPIRDFFGLDARGVAEYSFHDAARFYVDPATLTPEQRAGRAANMQALRAYAGDPYMHDPGLRARLPELTRPTLVLWGESDRIVTPEYGAAFAAALPEARFEVIAQAGHLPQIEQPEATLARIEAFSGEVRRSP